MQQWPSVQMICFLHSSERKIITQNVQQLAVAKHINGASHHICSRVVGQCSKVGDTFWVVLASRLSQRVCATLVSLPDDLSLNLTGSWKTVVKECSSVNKPCVCTKMGDHEDSRFSCLLTTLCHCYFIVSTSSYQSFQKFRLCDYTGCKLHYKANDWELST